MKDLASQAGLLYNDDTSIRILSLMKENQTEPEPERKGMRTTAVVAELGDHTIHLYESGRSHAGENLEELLGRRPEGLPPPIQMTDALASNTSHCQSRVFFASRMEDDGSLRSGSFSPKSARE